MLNDAPGFSKVFLAVGYTDLRRGIDGLATIIKFKYKLTFQFGLALGPRLTGIARYDYFFDLGFFGIIR